ncbi:hypothetical protein RUM44_013196 [Polyplax serrata]|uniref:Endonuclease/exonuclease/phosphatase domain-containing protein n=1 Tax=Polyplax serrata TaxID=468196 RepID=A0ABR1BHF0_POLSC
MSADEGVTLTRATYDKLTADFAKITGTNEALAQTFLQDHEWNLERSVQTFYEALNEEEKQNKRQNVAPAINFPRNFTGAPSKQVDPDDLYDPRTVQQLFGEGKAVTTEPPPRLKFLTWNLDGLDVHNLKRRTRAVIKLIEKHEPDIIFLQEVIPESADYFESKLPEYKCIRGGEDDYFTMTLLRIFTIFYDNSCTVDFPDTQMGRNLLITEAHMGKLKFKLLNTHLESTAEHSAERMNQLKIAFDKCELFSTDYTVIFGGDLNLRDKEAQVPRNFFDLWEYCGCPQQFKYTWDMTKNTNSKANFGRFKPRCRFDRVYFRFSSPKRAFPKHFALIGSEKVPQTQSFPSDHWGIVILFDLDHRV